MTKQLRLALTKSCNLSCWYCAMQKPETLQTFKTISVYELLQIARDNDYDTFCLTGGEPTVDLYRLFFVAQNLKLMNVHTPIYLYSNGLLFTEQMLKLLAYWIDGINIGANEKKCRYSHWLKIHQEIPVRIHRWEKYKDSEMEKFCQKAGIGLKYWTLNQCDTENEDRMILE